MDNFLKFLVLLQTMVFFFFYCRFFRNKVHFGRSENFQKCSITVQFDHKKFVYESLKIFEKVRLLNPWENVECNRQFMKIYTKKSLLNFTILFWCGAGRGEGGSRNLNVTIFLLHN